MYIDAKKYNKSNVTKMFLLFLPSYIIAIIIINMKHFIFFMCITGHKSNT